MSDQMETIFNDYGCHIDKFIEPDTLEHISDNFNKIILVDNIKYTLCKDDAGIFVLVSSRYVIKIYSQNTYNKLVNIYHRLWRNNHGNVFNHIEKIYYYFSLVNGVTIHDTYPNFTPKHGTCHLTINELLLPLFPNIDKSNIVWNKDMVKKLLIDTSLALIVLHQINIVHGDTTPDNVGLRISDNNFVLYDFGDAHDGYDYLSDVNRFLKSILITYKSFFGEYINEIKKIKETVNTGNYGLYDFYNAINTNFE